MSKYRNLIRENSFQRIRSKLKLDQLNFQHVISGFLAGFEEHQLYASSSGKHTVESLLKATLSVGHLTKSQLHVPQDRWKLA